MERFYVELGSFSAKFVIYQRRSLAKKENQKDKSKQLELFSRGNEK